MSLSPWPPPAPWQLPFSEQPTTLYRFFNADDELIYVGITIDFRFRKTAHRAKPWFGEVARYETEVFKTRTLAEAAEEKTIRKHLPKYNRCYIAKRVRAERDKQGPNL